MKLLLTLLLLATPRAEAHAPSDSYLDLTVDGAAVHGLWKIDLRDANDLVPLDLDRDGRVTWGELKRRQAELVAATLPYILRIAAVGPSRAIREDAALRSGVNTFAGWVTCEGVARALGREWVPADPPG